MSQTNEPENYAEILAQTEQRVFQIKQARSNILSKKYNNVINLNKYYEEKISEMYRRVVRAIYDRKDTLLTKDTILSGIIEVEITADEPDAWVINGLFRDRYSLTYGSPGTTSIVGLHLCYTEQTGRNKYKFVLETDLGTELDESDLTELGELNLAS